MAQTHEESNAFTFDEDEDMQFILEQAAQAGSAAVDEQHEGADYDPELFRTEEPAVAVTVPEPVAVAPEEPVFSEPVLDDLDEEYDASAELDSYVEEPAFAVEPDNSIEDIQKELEALQAETAAALEPKTEPVKVQRRDSIRDLEQTPPVFSTPESRLLSHDRPVTPEPVAVAQPEPKPAQREPEATHHAPARIVRQTEQEQIAHAKAILAAADEYRKLRAQERAVVAQLITQDADFADDAASIAIRAINADELTFATMEALKTAKAEEPVDRAFYILGLSEAVRTSLGQLCSAFTGNELKSRETLAYSRELVREIEKLDSDAIGFVVSTEAVLRAARQS